MQRRIIVFITLTAVTALGVYLRLSNLGHNPNGLYVDEASTGYNAWSIALTGKDEYGKSFPLLFRFLGSYTPPIYTYLTSLVVIWNGLSSESVRLISALSGIILIPLVFYFLIKLNILKNIWLNLFATFLFAISPWSIFFSRIGYEVNLGFLFFTLGVLFLWLGLKKTHFVIFGLFFLGLSTNTYQTEKFLSHLLLFFYLVIFRREIFKKENKISLAAAFIVYFLTLLPQIILFNTPANLSRSSGIFYLGAITDQTSKLDKLPYFLSLPIAFAREFMSQYLTYFSPRNLFFQPDSDLQRSLPELSTFYPWMIVLYIFGLFKLIKERGTLSGKFIILLLLLIPIPAALTGDPFSSQRSLPLVLAIIFLFALGLENLRNLRFNFLIYSAFLFLSISSLLYLYKSQGVLLPNERAVTWGYGFERLAQEMQKRPGEKFVIDSGRSKPAYIEIAFYLKYPPQLLQQQVNPSIKNHYYGNIPWDGYYNLGFLETRTISWQNDIYKDQILVGDELAISESQANEHFLTKIFEIKGPAGEIIFEGFRTNPSLKCQTQSDDKRCAAYFLSKKDTSIPK